MRSSLGAILFGDRIFNGPLKVRHIQSPRVEIELITYIAQNERCFAYGFPESFTDADE
jgi:hypothetical protein